MKGLRKFLTPFAPDQSGAVSVLYELGGILIICDAGGCVGNICGFDEPRWLEKKSAIFSAGLRDMDAIMGRDDELVKKLILAASEIDANFVALIGTPVPSVIGTDYYALTKMAENKLKIPVIAVDTNGMELSDKGASKAYLELVRRFVTNRAVGEVKNIGEKEASGEVENIGEKAFTGCTYCCGIFGANPLEIGIKNAAKKLNKIYDRPFVYGAADTFCKLGEASKVKENIVMSVSGLASARLMEKMMGIPFKTENPFAVDFIKRNEEVLKSKAGSPFKVLITDDQISGNVMRKELKKMGAEVVVSSWFSMDAELKEEGDVKLLEEDDYIRVVSEGDFDFVIADPVQKRMIEKKFDGVFIEKNQFQISGVLYDTCD